MYNTITQALNIQHLGRFFLVVSVVTWNCPDEDMRINVECVGMQLSGIQQGCKLTLARVQFRPGEWFVRPDQPGGRMGILGGFIDHIVIASLALISSGLSRQNEILNRVRLF